jgi:hypothetical protein
MALLESAIGGIAVTVLDTKLAHLWQAEFFQERNDANA